MGANRHGAGDLKQMQSLPLEYKINMTKERIRAWYETWTRYEIVDVKTDKTRFFTFAKRDWSDPELGENEYIKSAYDGAVYLSFSGGKDSTVLKHIVDSMYADVPSVFVNTGLEYPEIQHFVREVKDGKYECFNSNVEILRPEMPFVEVIKKYGYPVVSKNVSNAVRNARNNIKNGDYSLRLCQLGVHESEYGGLKVPDGYDFHKVVAKSKFGKQKWRFLLDAPFECSEQCCAVMKHRPVEKYEKETGRMTIVGTMASESVQRNTNWIQHGCNAFELKRPTSQPLSFWTEQDILHYIKKFNVPYCPAYGEIRVKNTSEFEGQIDMIDYLGSYEPEDVLETTGCNRTGCMFCMFGCHLEKEPNRFQRMKTTHPKQYVYCMEKLGLKEVLDYIGVPYE